jgi:phosphatidylglycerol:prolipoprotein diacylglycerol transferase
MIFPGSDGVPRHPSQLYEAALEGALNFVVLYVLARCGGLRRRGLVTGVFGIVYGAARIFCEFYRDPDANPLGLGGNLTMGMVLSAPMILIGLAVAAYSLRGRSARA